MAKSPKQKFCVRFLLTASLIHVQCFLQPSSKPNPTQGLRSLTVRQSVKCRPLAALWVLLIKREKLPKTRHSFPTPGQECIQGLTHGSSSPSSSKLSSSSSSQYSSPSANLSWTWWTDRGSLPLVCHKHWITISIFLPHHKYKYHCNFHLHNGIISWRNGGGCRPLNPPDLHRSPKWGLHLLPNHLFLIYWQYSFTVIKFGSWGVYYAKFITGFTDCPSLASLLFFCFFLQYQGHLCMESTFQFIFRRMVLGHKWIYEYVYAGEHKIGSLT